MIVIDEDGVMAIRGWMKLEGALKNLNKYLLAEYNISGAQLALLRIIEERFVRTSEQVTLADLRLVLSTHPATLGQMIERLSKRGFVSIGKSKRDGRVRVVKLTDHGREVIASAPLAGPVKLRSGVNDRNRRRVLELIRAFDDAIELFDLENFVEGDKSTT